MKFCPMAKGNYDNSTIKKLRIYLSYGHDANEELVRMIKTDLEKRGHDVWFDKNKRKKRINPCSS